MNQISNRSSRVPLIGRCLGPVVALTIWAALVAANTRWLSLDTLPPFPGGDPARHAAESVQIYRAATAETPGIAWFGRIAKLHTEYPPVVGLINTAFYARLGVPVSNAEVSRAAGRYNALFLLVLLLSTYAIGAGIAGPRAGALAAFLAAAYPLIFSQARYFMLDIPVAAMAALSVWLLIRTRAFHDARWSLLFGVSLGLGMLTKQSFGLFLVGPTLAAAAFGVRRAWRRAPEDRAEGLAAWAAGALLALVAFVTTAAWWYIVQARDSNYLGWLHYIANLSSGPPECGGRFFTVCGLTYYFRALNNATSFGYLALFVVALTALAASRTRGAPLADVIAWAGGAYLLLSIPQSKEPRYEMALLPAVAVLTAVGLERLMSARLLRRARLGAALVTAVVAFGIVQFAAISFGVRWLPEGNDERWSSDGHFFGAHWFPNVWFQRYDAYGPHPVQADWRTGAILDAIVESFYPGCPGRPSLAVGVFTDAPAMVSHALYYAAAARAPVLSVDRIQSDTIPNPGQFGFLVIHVSRSSERPAPPAPANFAAVARINVPDGAVTVYRNRALDLSLERPVGLAVDSAGRMYVAETGRHCVAEFDRDGTARRDWGGEGHAPGQLELPKGIAIGTSGDVYVADFGNNRIAEFDREGRFVRTIGTAGTGPGHLGRPWGVAARPDGGIVVAELGNHRIQEFDAEGRSVRTWGGFGVGPGQLRDPKGLALDQAGNVYVVDSGNDRVEKFTADGRYVTLWGAPGPGDGEFLDPVGIWVDGSGVYVTDKGPGAARVTQFDPNGRLLGALRVGVPASPMDVVRTADGTLYCTDFEGAKLVRVGRMPLGGDAGPRPGSHRPARRSMTKLTGVLSLP